MEFVDSFGGLTLIFRYSQTILDMDSLDHQNFLIHLDLALHFRDQIPFM
jgi:hypothetical protein